MADGRSIHQDVTYYHNNNSNSNNNNNSNSTSESQLRLNMSKSSSSTTIDEMEAHRTDKEELLLGEQILQNRHVAFPPSQPPHHNHLETIIPHLVHAPQSHPQQQQQQPQQQPQQNINAPLDTDNIHTLATGVQRNYSLPTGYVIPNGGTTSTHDGSHNHAKQPPLSPSHDSTRTTLPPVNATTGPVSIAVDTTSTNNGQVVTKKKGRFKFVEQVPTAPRLSNDNLVNDGTIGAIGAIAVTEPRPQQQQQHVAPTSSIPASMSNGNTSHAFPMPPQPPFLSSLPPAGPPPDNHLQPQMSVTTPSVQKKGRFVVTTLPAPMVSTTNNGSMPPPANIIPPPLHSQPPILEPPVADATHVRRPSDDVNNASANMGIQPVTTPYTYPPGDGIATASVNSQLPLASSYLPPPPPPPPQLNGQSPGHNHLPHPTSNSENSSPITSQTPTYISSSSGMITDDPMVQPSTAVAQHYDTLQPGTSSASSSRQVSPKVVSKPVAAVKVGGTTSNSNSGSVVMSASQQQQQQPQQQPQRLSQHQQQPPGFGKMLYFLDQMKLEVTEADQNIKNLQTEMKCLKEKNKELEAKARDMERKLNQEKALREVAETRVKALKKKVRAYESTSTGTIPTTASSLSSSTPATTTNGSIPHTNSNNNNYNPNDTSIDAGYGGVSGTGSTRDDESVGTNQTYDKQQ